MTFTPEQLRQLQLMASGELYPASDNCVLLDLLEQTHQRCFDYNALPPNAAERRDSLIRTILGATGSQLKVISPFLCDYGFNITVGERFFANAGLIVLDEAPVAFGDNVFIGPNCGFYTAGHPLDAHRRDEGFQYAKPICVGNSVWFGGNVVVLPGVTIGDGTVVAAGSVVTKDLPAGVLAAGNPCRVIREIS